ncbi:plant UBX domain-containing protein 4-like [Senna tora]|uniref:Plant UBX domain-containing protein 4-like n=1 Tax=Senna tora TaxID=362788 RepID=A0A834W9I4_9FABA|nr:plant UBX domain-containing protein 4-like [Senna tora]
MELSDPNSHPNNASLINDFCEITSSSKEEALFFLESHNFDLDAAVTTFFDNNVVNNDAAANNPSANVVINDNTDSVVAHPPLPPRASSPNSPSESHSPEFSPSQSPSRSRSASPTPSRAPYELRSRRRGKAATKPSGSRTGRVRTLSDLRRPARDSSDSDSDETQEYYTGGEKSGMLVQDPTKGNNSVDDFFDRARQSAVDKPPEHSQKSKSFTGTARLLSGESVQSAPPPPPAVVTHTITFWRNGFSVDDGPLRRLDDPQNAPFLESVKNSECPKELEPADGRTTVHVELTRRDENYPEPVKPRHLPFRGLGRTLGSSSSGGEASVEPNTAPLPSMGLVIDEAQPVTSIQLRLADGTRMVSRFNHHHTISDVRAFIDASRPGGARSYQLQTMGFPPKQLTDLDQTIEQAGIANSVVIQRL